MTEAYIRKRGIKHIINERKEMISDVAIYAIDGSKFHLNPKFAGVNEFVS